MHIQLIQTTSTALQLNLSMAERSISQWVAEQRSFFPAQRAEKDRTGAIFYSSCVAMASTSFAHGPNLKRFPLGAGRNSSVPLAISSSRSQIRSKSAASNRVFPIWCVERLNYFSTMLVDTCSSSMADKCAKPPRKTTEKERLPKQ